MPTQPTHKKIRVGARFGIFGGSKYVLKKISPADLLEEPEVLPFSFFSKKEVRTASQIALEKAGIFHNNKKDDASFQLDLIKFVLKKCVVSENGKPFDIEEFIARPSNPKNISIMLQLFWEAINLSFKRFISKVSISHSNVMALAVMSKRFSRPPIEILFPFGDYSEMDAWMFNTYVTSVLIDEEAKAAAK